MLHDQVGLRSGRADMASNRSVAIVGFGSVGSKVAEMLLHSGVHRFVLVDGDVMLPATLERHTLNWRDVGFRKVHAVKRRLLQIVSGADVQVIPVNLDWQRSARSHAAQVEGIAGCDLVVDATGDVPTSLMLSALATVNGKAFLSVEVFEGGSVASLPAHFPDGTPRMSAGVPRTPRTARIRASRPLPADAVRTRR